MEEITFAISAVYVLLALFVLAGLIRRHSEPDGDGLTSASVIIFVRMRFREAGAHLRYLAGIPVGLAKLATLAARGEGPS